jgi:hypothetical protein
MLFMHNGAPDSSSYVGRDQFGTVYTGGCLGRQTPISWPSRLPIDVMHVSVMDTTKELLQRVQNVRNTPRIFSVSVNPGSFQSKLVRPKSTFWAPTVNLTASVTYCHRNEVIIPLYFRLNFMKIFALLCEKKLLILSSIWMCMDWKIGFIDLYTSLGYTENCSATADLHIL